MSRPRVRLVIAAVVVAMLAGCGTHGRAAVSRSVPPASNVRSGARAACSYTPGFLAKQYGTPTDPLAAACSYTPGFLAKQYGTPTDPLAIARAYADQLGTSDPAAREAAIDGCMAGMR